MQTRRLKHAKDFKTKPEHQERNKEDDKLKRTKSTETSHKQMYPLQKRTLARAEIRKYESACIFAPWLPKPTTDSSKLKKYPAGQYS
jgi:hypothetical protein